MGLNIKTRVQLFKERLKRSPAVRKLLKPSMDKKLALVDEEYTKSEDAQYLRSLKDAHKGERCFVVGNGPSLRHEDLDMLRNEYAFATNGIYHMFDKTDWRPSFYVCCDRNALTLTIDDVLGLDLERMFLDIYAKPKIDDRKTSNITYVNQHPLFFGERKYMTENIGFAEDPTRFVCAGYTVTYVALQLAIYMGFSNIYLIGIDHNYGRSIDTNGRISQVNELNDHFFKSDEPGFFYYEGVEYAYRLARSEAEKRSIEILNATRGGNLELFKRVNLNDVMCDEPD